MHQQGYHYPLDPDFHLLDRIVANLDETSVDHAVLGPTPTLFFYDVDSESGAEFCRALERLDKQTGGGERGPDEWNGNRADAGPASGREGASTMC